MVDTYVLVFLEPGQMAPDGSTGVGINDGIVCIVPEDDCDTKISKTKLKQTVKKGNKLPGDKDIPDYYNIRGMTEEEIYLYNNPPEVEEP